MSDAPSVPRWQAVRPWRNNSPGDLRTLADGEQWDGQIGVDFAAGGPFVEFRSAEFGWRALAKLLLNYHLLHGICTISEIVGRFAPAADNNNEMAYCGILTAFTGFGEDQVLDLSAIATMVPLCEAISIAEGGARLPWSAADRIAGVTLALTGAA